jgi:hypothetical protein
MREYGRIKVQFWTDAKILRLSTQGKLLFSYLLTGPHANGIGCFRLPFGYIEADMGWVSDTVTETLSGLLREGLIERCDKTGWTLIANYLKHNPIDNPNVAKGAVGQIQAVPPTLPFYAVFKEKLKPYAERFPKGFINGLGIGSPNGSGKGIPNGMANIEMEIEPEIEIEPEMDSLVDPPVAANSLELIAENGSSLANIDVDAALRVWNDLASELSLPLVQKLTDTRKTKLRARLRDAGGIGGWASVLVKIRESRFLRGETKGNWRANFDFVLQESSFNKLKEGAYSDRKAEVTPPTPPTFKLSSDIVATLKAANFTDEEIKRWFDDAEFFDGGKRITVKSSFVKDWIGSHYETKLCKAFGDAPVLETAPSSPPT